MTIAQFRLKALENPIKNGYWNLVGKTISLMHQDHKLEGDKRRRQREAILIIVHIEPIAKENG